MCRADSRRHFHNPGCLLLQELLLLFACTALLPEAAKGCQACKRSSLQFHHIRRLTPGSRHCARVPEADFFVTPDRPCIAGVRIRHNSRCAMDSANHSNKGADSRSAETPILTLYQGYRRSKGSRATVAATSSWLESTRNTSENRPGRDSRYTYPLRIGDRKNNGSKKLATQRVSKLRHRGWIQPRRIWNRDIPQLPPLSDRSRLLHKRPEKSDKLDSHTALL